MNNRKKLYFSIILILVFLLILKIAFRTPYYGSIFGGIVSKPISFEEFTNLGVKYINKDNIYNSYSNVLDKNLSFHNLIQKKYGLPFIYSGFDVVKIRENCFIYKGSVDSLENKYNLNLVLFKKINYNVTEKCTQNCNIYITEKGLLKSDDLYNCD